MTHQVALKEVKVGDYFRLKDSESAPVWVRGEYDRTERKFEVFKFDDVNHSAFKRGDAVVWVGFTF